MSLTGHLDVFPLEEVLRLLSRSYKTGCLRIDTPDQHGRVYLDSGSLTFATIANDDDFRRQLSASGLVTEDGLRSTEIGGRALAEVLTPGTGVHQLTDLVREEVVESLYRIRKPGKGQFVFNVDVNPRYRMEQAFDVELCVAEADRRAADWADIELVIPTIDLELAINAEAPNGEPVTLAPNTWKLIAAFGGSATVRQLSDRLGISQFRVAKDLGGLARSGLVQPLVAAAPAPVEPVYYQSTPEQLIPSAAEPAGFGWTSHVEAPAEPEPPVIPATVETPEHDRSWWEEPVEPGRPHSESSSRESSPSEAESGKAALIDEEPPPQEAPEEEPSTLSDSFLDRVFAQLENTPEGQSTEEQGEEPDTPATEPGALGHGFLKRRRMSSIGLDDV
ncbi:MAG TPA: DUF4388 domain-containing protein [Acidimicrobiia bacterium]|nr:DUF4388 domain-containing protein [Acidimicrobiia bacterium]